MSNDAHALTQTLQPPRMETGMYASSLILTSIKYRLWVMRMEVSLEAHDLWGVLDGSEVNHKKDRLVLLSCIDNPQVHLRVSKQSNRHQEECKGELEGSLHIPCGNG